MKKILMLLTLCIGSNLLAVPADVVESLTICKDKSNKYLVTITHSEDDKTDRVMFINDWMNLSDTDLEYFVPIQNVNSLRTIPQIQKWMSVQFNTISCHKVSEKTVQQELENQ